MTNKPKKVKNPPIKLINSVQYDLFINFIECKEQEPSNAIEFWDRVPKYFLSDAQQRNLRTPEGLASVYTYEYSIKDLKGKLVPYKVEIQPALIEQPDGSSKAFFPTKTEENIEEILKKIFANKTYSHHNPDKMESWVKFSYSMIRTELYKQGSGLRYDQVKRSLEIMSKCVLTIWEDGKRKYTAPILQEYSSVDRSQYLADTDTLHVARLPIFISHALNTGKYRQFNYKRFMEFNEQLSRFIYKRLVNRYTNASATNSYHFMYSNIQQESGLLQQKRERKNREKVISALDELKNKNVLLDYKVESRKEGRKITDVKYTVLAGPNFISEQIVANKRLQKIRRNLQIR